MISQDNNDPQHPILAISQQDILILRRKIDETIETNEPPIDGETYINTILETIAGIKRGLNDITTGQTRPLSEFDQDMQQKYGLSD
jgi:hypothetical protein